MPLFLDTTTDENFSSQYPTVLLHIAWLISIFLIGFAIFHIYLSLSKKKTFIVLPVSLGVVYVLGSAMWILIDLYADIKATWITAVVESFSKGFKNFALGNSADDLFEEATYIKDYYYSLTKIFCLYATQIAAFVVFSTSLIANYFVNFSNWRMNFNKKMKTSRKLKGDSSYTASVNYVYTDMPYDDIAPFTDRLRKEPNSTVTMVFMKTFVATQEGSELMETFRLNRYEVKAEGMEPYAFEKYSILNKKRTINFYSIFEKDIDNLKMANTAIEFLNKNKTGMELKKQGNINFFISVQDESMNDRNDTVIGSNGRIRFINEYNWTASKFVFENPVTRFINVDPKNFNEFFDKEKNFNVHFIGFGRVNRALAQRMLTVYQFPSEVSQVHYKVHDINSEAYDRFQVSIEATNEVYNDENHFYPQPNFLNQFSFEEMDVFDEKSLQEFAKNIVKNIYDAQHDEESHDSRNLVFISLGDKEMNIDVALKIRQYVKNISETYGEELLQSKDIKDPSRRYKKVIIYPYIKDNQFFKQGTDLFERLTKLYINENNKDNKKINEFIEELHSEQYLEYLTKVYNNELGEKNNKEDNAKYKEFKCFRTCFNSYISYIFEIKSYTDFDFPQTKKFKDLNIETEKAERLLKSYRKAAFNAEECPIVVFGRGSYIGDELDEAILQLSKQLNRMYSSNKEIFTIDEDWIHLSYAMKRANIDAVLCFPFRLGILGYKLKWDKKRIVPQYLIAKKEGKDELAEKIKNRNPILVECHERNLDFDVLKKVLNYPSNYNPLDNEKGNYKGLLSKEFKEYIEGKTFNSNTAPELFYEFYENAYKAYAEGNNDESIINKVETAISDYYTLMYKSRLNKELVSIRDMEHNRWYLTNAICGTVPRDKKYVTENITDRKSKDRLRHLCMTTNEGLEEFGSDVLKNMVRNRAIFVKNLVRDEDGNILNKTNYIPGSIRDLTFNFVDCMKGDYFYFKQVFGIVFNNDILQYHTIKNLLDEQENDINKLNLKEAKKKYFFILKESENGIIN